jgi:stage II sporulation protein D
LLLALAAALPAPAAAGSLFLIKGGGWGNDVGMSQWGAEGYALHGWSYGAILAHFYPHTTITRTAPPPVRVLVIPLAKHLSIRSTAPFALGDASGDTLHVHRFAISASKPPRAGDKRLRLPVTIAPGAEPLSVNGKAYRGALTIRRAGRDLSVVNTVPIELYLRGVVPSEMPKHWSMQAYEAQAIAARSYALASMRSRGAFDLYGDTRSQLYGGIAAETPLTNAAVNATAGQVLTYGGRVIVAYYDSTSGGRTAPVQAVFSNLAPEPYLVSVSDPYDSISPYHSWRVAVSAQTLAQHFEFPVDDVRVELVDGVATQVELLNGNTTRVLPARAFEQSLGLRSIRFSVSVAELDATAQVVRRGSALELEGFVRDFSGVTLEARTATHGWARVRRVRTRANGRFVTVVRVWDRSSYRLFAEGEAGPAITVDVRAPRPRPNQPRTSAPLLRAPRDRESARSPARSSRSPGCSPTSINCAACCVGCELLELRSRPRHAPTLSGSRPLSFAAFRGAKPSQSLLKYAYTSPSAAQRRSVEAQSSSSACE